MVDSDVFLGCVYFKPNSFILWLIYALFIVVKTLLFD